ncbi:MAG: hypothetical protein K9K65_08930 [Desulfarculaceae bacterium]|nr:hypothetical protein [Desulfarculaceae bacterium]MCF8045893.1 hypothetical protein [Desulfarculaceae bacterium]MCF8066508.1 hypothetical protein [Desulfarculaceae bacterium]MCF8097951.1 hypothetical protein [Desulfarculaceae bacterium]MCF8121096.1 hypothetical protein [Desulfarculaceae bacterium]
MNPHDFIIFHPAWQVAFTLLGLYVAWLGIKRLRSLHLGQQTTFPRPRHILLGKAALVGLILGTAGGAIMVRWLWQSWLVTGVHGWLGLMVACLALVGLATGLVLERRPKARKGLPLLHGLVNLTLLALCLVNFYFGDHILDALGD